MNSNEEPVFANKECSQKKKKNAWIIFTKYLRKDTWYPEYLSKSSLEVSRERKPQKSYPQFYMSGGTSMG